MRALSIDRLTEVEQLSVQAIDVTARMFDWSDSPVEFESYETGTCAVCGRGAVSVCETRDCENFGGDIEPGEGPMMNYYYPLPDDLAEPSDAVRAIASLPLCLVRFTEEEEWALALTGGGMDLSWEIAEAFMRLGYLPPLVFCDLPDYRHDLSPDSIYRWVLDGCKRTCEVTANRANWTREKLDRLGGSE